MLGETYTAIKWVLDILQTILDLRWFDLLFPHYILRFFSKMLVKIMFCMCIYVCVWCMRLYLHVHGHTCGGAHGVCVVSMEDIETGKVICLLQSLSISYIEAGSLTHWNWNVSCQRNGHSVGSSLWTLTFGPLICQQCTLCYDTLALILERGCWGSQEVPLVLMLGSDHVYVGQG